MLLNKNFSKVIQISVLGLTYVLVSGCAVDKAGCDPTQTRSAGFFTKLSCDLSGSYAARAEDQRQQTAQLESERENLRIQLSRLESERKELSEATIRSRAKRDRVINSLNKTLDSLKASSANNQMILSKIEDTKNKLLDLKKNADKLSSAQIASQTQAIQSEMDEVTEFYVNAMN